ncbi:MAG: class I adenylate-forming enzyme family protein [Acidimicrobiia bacterium]
MTRAETTADLLREVAAEHPDREAYLHGGKQATYAWLDHSTDGFATTLLDLGVAKGDVVTLLLPSSIKFAVCYLGALRVGAVTSALNLRLGPMEQASIFEQTEPRVTVVGDGAEVPADADPGIVLHVSELGPAFGAAPPADGRLPRLDATDPTCIVWTSGTTGAPKGAVYDHATQAAISRNMGELTAPGDRRLSVLPFAHVGYMTRMWDELVNATTLILPGEPWTPAEHLRMIREAGVTMVTGVPTQWQRVLDHPDLEITDFSGVRVAGLGGASIAPELVGRMRERLGCPVLARYTSTEAGVCTSTRIGDADDVVAHTVGSPAPEVELRLVDSDGLDVEPGAVGEIICRSPAMMRGYWRDPERTAEVIDTAGFLHTGDLGQFDDDGNLRIVGRLKEMYIRGGYNVYPAEVEGVLADHPSVDRSAVVCVTHADLGEIGVAFVVPAPGATPELAELRTWCRDRLSDYKAPDRLVIVDDLPVTAMMKIDKLALVARVQEEQ